MSGENQKGRRGQAGVVVAAFVTLVLATAIGYVGWDAYRKAQLPPRTVTENRMHVEGAEGASFDVTYTHTEGKGEGAYVSVLATVHGAGPSDATLLFRYDPGPWDGTLPVIATPGTKKVMIRVPAVAEVLVRKAAWNDWTVDYRIGGKKIFLPGGGV